MAVSGNRVPIRAAFALAGAGSLGTFLAGATRECLIAIRAHNEAIADPSADDGDDRLLNDEWGTIVIDAIGGSSAGAFCGSQLVRALFEPDYLGVNDAIDAPHTMTGDWIELGAFDALTVDGNTPKHVGPIEAPGWTIMSGAKLFEMAQIALAARKDVDASQFSGPSPIDPDGIVAIGITLTDLLGYHEYAEFECRSVLGHPNFGAVKPGEPTFHGYRGEPVRDLGILKHAEIRKLFVGHSEEATRQVAEFLEATRRKGRARAIVWGDSTDRLAALATASASLPLALGPLAVTDRATHSEKMLRRLYTDGGVMNNKPIAPALRLARWQDEVRLMRVLAREDHRFADAFDPDDVEKALNYRRICFFVDAFPERYRHKVRSPHPDQAFLDCEDPQLEKEDLDARNRAIDEVLTTPTRGLGALFESMMASLRAQDIRGIAEMNYRIRERDRFIGKVIRRAGDESDFVLDSLEKAHAYSSVCLHDEGKTLSVAHRLAVAERVYEANRLSGLAGRRRVTMVPVFAPENLVAVLAGEGLYALGGLLSRDARMHDTSVGMTVARNVMASLEPSRESTAVNLRDAPESVLPRDTAAVVERLKVAIEAAIEGDGTGSRFIRALVAFPLRLNPLVRLVKGRLDERVMGLPTAQASAKSGSDAERGIDGKQSRSEKDPGDEDTPKRSR